MQLTDQHRQLDDTVTKFVRNEINPYVEEWERQESFPAHALFKKLGELGLLGLKYPEAYGGLGLDFSYSMVMAEAIGAANCGGVPMAIGVHTDMCTPALAQFTSLAMGFNPSSFTILSLITITNAAPSLVWEEFPAVTVPPDAKAGFSLASPSGEVSARTPSSLSTT